MPQHQPLTAPQIATLKSQGCTAEGDDWSRLAAAPGFDPSRVAHVRFAGAVRLGAAVTIRNIGIRLANVDIADGASVQDVGLLETTRGATFGNGVEVEVLNEGGGREIVLFNVLDSQFAHMLCLHRHRPRLIEKLRGFAEAQAAAAKADMARIGRHAVVHGVGRMVDVAVGDHAVIEGAASLTNGTILSSADAPTRIGAAVHAASFIIAEGASVTDGAVLAKSFVGQGCRIGKQFSAEGSVFFANCEAFHGEACSVFAGPYSVTHHKSTLLIAAMVSFYNAGSGTNQSNHMYKLGPVHEGKLERGCKTGSFSYMMWPCRVGPFSVVLGKHTRNFDTSDFPFSHIEAGPDGRCHMTPGFNLSTVGTVRDGAKWPTRDRRAGAVKRDRISFDVFSPLTVGRMLRGTARLKKLQDETPRDVETVTVSGAEIKRVLLRSGQKFYRYGIHVYLAGKAFERLEAGAGLGAPDGAVFSEEWVDVGGLLMPRDRLTKLQDDVESGAIGDLASLNAALDAIGAAYAEDEWAWVRWAYRQVFDEQVDAVAAATLAETYRDAKTKFLNLVLVDATKEFDATAQTGFGQDAPAADAAADFRAVRGDYDGNKFVKQMRGEIAALEDRIARFTRV